MGQNNGLWMSDELRQIRMFSGREGVNIHPRYHSQGIKILI